MNLSFEMSSEDKCNEDKEEISEIARLLSENGYKIFTTRGTHKFISEKNLRVVPTSPKIARFVRGNRRYKQLLPVGIKL